MHAKQEPSSSTTEKVAQQDEAAQLLKAQILDYSKKLAVSVDQNSGARKAIPVRKSFVRNDIDGEDAPLKKLVGGKGGRGATVTLLLYIALIWKCAKEPFDVTLSARQWAELLGLPDSYGKGSRRVANAINTLEKHNLISVEKVRGGASTITLLDESGDDSAYKLPSTAYSRKGRKRDLYFKISTELWTLGHIQQLSSAGLAMLLVLLSESGHRPSEQLSFKKLRPIVQGQEVWFTTENFPKRYGISASMRSRGTKELEEAGLLKTKRRPVGPLGSQPSFTTEKVRKVYYLQGPAVVKEPKESKKD